MCLVYQATLNEADLHSLAPVLTKLAHVSMLFIVEMHTLTTEEVKTRINSTLE